MRGIQYGQRIVLRLMLTLIGLLSAGCGNLSQQVQTAGIAVGDTESSVRQALGKPTREESHRGYTVLRYCNTDDAGVYGDQLYDFVFREGYLVYTTDYINTHTGFCSSFFRPIDWREVERGYELLRPALAAERYSQIWDEETYNIDLLRITTSTRKQSDVCASGGIHRLKLEGQIGPDSSFAMAKLMSQLKPCSDALGRTLMPLTVELRSGGGLLEDGYKLGEALRTAGATTYIPEGAGCASSCAVAFLGGHKRIVDEGASILFHAPYFTGENEYGKQDINCDVGDEALQKLREYYRSMTDFDTGERLFDRTLWYCSADDGWVVTGANAAELYGIATEK